MPYKKGNRPVHMQRWADINTRCYNPNCPQYHDWGGRGITNYWRHDFKGFNTYLQEHLGDCPPGYSIDRIDNDGNYEPGNLRWASKSEQGKNRRRWKRGFPPPDCLEIL
jgi:hypothetical protein